VKAWIDIDNPPQVRCFLPLVRRFQEAGHDVLLTARASGETFAILRSEGANFEPIGSSFGRGLPRKLFGLGQRTWQLVKFLRQQQTPVDFVLTGSRSAHLAARKLGMPSFVIIDYEYVNLLVYQLSRSHILYPSVIDPAVFRDRGIHRKHLMPFEGLKEDISFADVDFASISPHDFGNGEGPAPRVLFRPPAEESHYHRSESSDLALELLRSLVSEGARIVFSPRYEWQIRYLDEVQQWKEDPIILREPIPSVSLLKGVDAVVSAGGTMVREAAYMDVPAYSVFQGRIGGVDRYLASIDRLSILSSPADFSLMRLRPNRSVSPLRNGSGAADEVIEMILDRANASNG
jgi:predicted glycosyltransferase